MIYSEAGTYQKLATLSRAQGKQTHLVIPDSNPRVSPSTIHVILSVRDNGTSPLVSYRRAVIRVGR